MDSGRDEYVQLWDVRDSGSTGRSEAGDTALLMATKRSLEKRDQQNPGQPFTTPDIRPRR